MRWLREIAETLYAVVLATGLMGGIWGAVYYTFGANGLAVRLLSGTGVAGIGLSGVVALPAALAAIAAVVFWLPRLQSSRPATALLGTVVVGGYAFLFRVFTVGV
jgi:hypothetical protein